MAKRKRRAMARKKTASKRGKAQTRVELAPKKGAKRAGRNKRVKALKKTASRPTEPPTQPTEPTEETLIVDIIDESVPGVVVVTEFEAVRTNKPEAPTPPGEGEGGSGIAEKIEEEH
jgi:hypothetical protein